MPLEPSTPLPDREFVAILERAEQQLELQILALHARGADASAAYREKQLRSIVLMLENVRAEAALSAQTLTTRSYGAGIAIADRAAGIAPEFGGSIHEQALRVFAAELSGAVSNALTTVGRQAADVFRTAGLKAAAEGVATGGTRRQASKALADELVRQGTTSFVDRAGRRWSLANYCRMAARTTTREAMTAGTINRMGERGDDLVEVSDHGDTDELCAQYAGGTFSLTGETPGYDVLDDYPPFHPNCLHVLVPAAATFDSLEAALADAGWL